MFFTCHDNGIVVFETVDYETPVKTIQSLPGKNSKLFTDGEPMVITRAFDKCHVSTPAEIRKYHELEKSWSRKNTFIWSLQGIEWGNYVRRSQESYWTKLAGSICQVTIDEMILIDTQIPRKLFEYVDLDDDWLRSFGFHVEDKWAHLKIPNHSFILKRTNVYEGVTDQNSAEIEAKITNGTPIIQYELGALMIRHVHHLQNLMQHLYSINLVRI